MSIFSYEYNLQTAQLTVSITQPTNPVYASGTFRVDYANLPYVPGGPTTNVLMETNVVASSFPSRTVSVPNNKMTIILFYGIETYYSDQYLTGSLNNNISYFNSLLTD